MGLFEKAKEFVGIEDDKKKPVDIMQQIDQASGDKELVNVLKNKLEQVRNSASRISYETTWMENAAYTIGFSGVKYSYRQKAFINRNNPTAALTRDQYNVNKLLPNLQNRMARLLKNPPRYDVLPNDNDEDAKDNARFKLDILTAKWDELKINIKRQPLVMWCQETGLGYFGVFWDDTKGNYIEDPMTKECFFEGDVRVDVISPFEIFPDPLANNFDDCQYFFKAKVRPLSYFRSRFKRGAEVKPEDTWLLSAQFEKKIKDFTRKGGAGTGAEDEGQSAIEIVYMERRSREHPNGRMITMANGIILKKGPLPTGDIPLVKFDDILTAGKYYPEAVVTHCRPIQDQYNRTIRRRSQWVNKLLNGKIISPRGNQINKEAFNDRTGEIIQYTPVPNAPNGGEPRALDMPNIPSYAYQEEERIDAQFGEVMGLGEVSKGTLPSASIPAIGMQLLVEQDDTRIGVEVANHEDGYARVGKLILDYVQKYYKTPRKMKFAGKNGLLIKKIDGSMLKGDNDVIVVPGSTIPGSKTLRRQEILNVYSQGLLGDPMDPKVKQNVLGMLEWGDVGEVYLDQALTQHRIDDEIEKIKSEIWPDIDEADNHIMHYQGLSRFRKSDSYQKLSDKSRMIFMATREEHLRLIMEQSGEPGVATPEQRESNRVAAEIKAQEEPAISEIEGDQLPLAEEENFETTEIEQGPPQGGM